MREDLVYIKTKSWLVDSSWAVLAGQPPRGTDHLPIVEIKDSFNRAKGSAGAFIPDLVARKSHFLALIECKPVYDELDRLKLEGILGSEQRLAALFADLSQKRLVSKRDCSGLTVLGLLAHGGPPGPTSGIVGQLLVSGEGLVVAGSWDDATLQSLSDLQAGVNPP